MSCPPPAGNTALPPHHPGPVSICPVVVVDDDAAGPARHGRPSPARHRRLARSLGETVKERVSHHYLLHTAPRRGPRTSFQPRRSPKPIDATLKRHPEKEPEKGGGLIPHINQIKNPNQMEFGIERYSSDSLWIFLKSLEYKNITVILFGFFSRKIQGFSSEGRPSYICYIKGMFSTSVEKILQHKLLFLYRVKYQSNTL